MTGTNNITRITPGIYSMDMVDMSNNVIENNSVTKLGLVGETLKGPAFQPYWVKSPSEYASVFGGTSAEKYKNTQYPRYELPYIANEYLSTGSSLCVVRTLGLSGYNAGPAWIITGKKSSDGEEGKEYAIAVLRSRGDYGYVGKYYDGGCECKRSYDAIRYELGERDEISGCTMPISYDMSVVTLDDYYVIGYVGDNCEDYKLTSGDTNGFDVSYGNLGRFTVVCHVGSGENDVLRFPVSLNKSDNNYILKVLGTTNDDKNVPLYVETLYDVTWEHMVNEDGYDTILKELKTYNVENYADYCGLRDVDGVLTASEVELSQKHLAKRYIYNKSLSGQYISPDGVQFYTFDYKTNTPKTDENGNFVISSCSENCIYTVREIIENHKRKYVYSAYDFDDINNDPTLSHYEKINLKDLLWDIDELSEDKHGSLLYNKEDNLYYKHGITPITCNLNDYKAQYRYSSTPWIVSNVKGSAENLEVNRLFRFHTISDGGRSQFEVKVSIENINPNSGEFDVVVRDYYDNDSSPKVLERFAKCSMSEGINSLEYQIGTVDGLYEGKSRYIMVEMAKDERNDMNLVPCGFLGYPVPKYDGNTILESGYTISTPPIIYNTTYNDTISKTKQYFGFSDLSGYDEDYFTYKGNLATIEDPDFLTECFHLDCRLNKESYSSETPTILVDGVEGYEFKTVDTNSRLANITQIPIIGTQEEMNGSIYEDIKLRKFTVMFEGGFDGWDIYRRQRSNTDNFSIRKYNGYINQQSGTGYAIDILKKPNTYNIEGTALTSDYYSTIAALSVLKNNNDVDINLLATPGIDTINNPELVREIFSIIEDRQDTFYIVTTPDKNPGMGDYDENLISPEDIASDFDRKDLYSDNAATFYPWVKIEDNGTYIWIPPTRDIVRDIALNDNLNSTMNLAPAGISGGKINAIRARKNLTTKESDEVYKERINPIRTLNQNGIYNMGQKTLRKEDDVMSRINVRRMVLNLKKTIAESCKNLLFEPITQSLSNVFTSTISGVMNGFQRQGAIEKWNMQVNGIKEQEEKLELNAVIYLKPIRSIEYISLNFVVTNNEIYFQD